MSKKIYKEQWLEGQVIFFHSGLSYTVFSHSMKSAFVIRVKFVQSTQRIEWKHKQGQWALIQSDWLALITKGFL